MVSTIADTPRQHRSENKLECRKELQNSNGRNRALRVGADLPSEFL